MWRRDSGPRNVLMTLGGGERLSSFVGIRGRRCRSLGPGQRGHRPEETAEKNTVWPRVSVSLGFGGSSYRTPRGCSLRQQRLGAHTNTDLQRGTGQSVPCPCWGPIVFTAIQAVALNPATSGLEVGIPGREARSCRQYHAHLWCPQLTSGLS